MFEITIFTKGLILFRCLTRTSSDNCFCTSSILDVWHGLNRLNIFPKSSSWDIWHRLHLLATFAKSFILDVWHGFHRLTVFVKYSITDVWRGFNTLIISSKSTSLNDWPGLQCLYLRCLTRIPFVICFRKWLHPRCLILDNLRSQRDDKLTVNYVKNLLQSPWKITSSMKSAWK